MSTRTIIEINHDCLMDLHDHPEILERLVTDLCGSIITGRLNKEGMVDYGLGVTILAQRHHSQKLTVTIG